MEVDGGSSQRNLVSICRIASLLGTIIRLAGLGFPSYLGQSIRTEHIG
jgi:hypothetical protein